MRSWKEALVGSWAVVRVADRVRRRGWYRCMFIESEYYENSGG